MPRSVASTADHDAGRRPRTASALTMLLVEALDEVLFGALDPDTLLVATARVLACELECLCMIERTSGDTTRLVALAHSDRAIAVRLAAAHRPTAPTSGERAKRIMQAGTPVRVDAVGASDLARYGLTNVEGWLGRPPTSFIAVPLVARGESLGVVWAISTRRARRMRAPEIESFVRVTAFVGLSLLAASAGPPSREKTATRRAVIAQR